MQRIPPPLQRSRKFTFRRDARGIETVHHNERAIAVLAPRGHITIGTPHWVLDMLGRATEAARDAGFWYAKDDVTVEVAP